METLEEAVGEAAATKVHVALASIRAHLGAEERRVAQEEKAHRDAMEALAFDLALQAEAKAALETRIALQREAVAMVRDDFDDRLRALEEAADEVEDDLTPQRSALEQLQVCVFFFFFVGIC